MGSAVSQRLDRALTALDVGLQSSPESTMFSDVAPTISGLCARCDRRDPVDGSEFCGPCRGFLLGDGPDPDLYEPEIGVWRDSSVRDSPNMLRVFMDEWVSLPPISAPRGGIHYVPSPDWDRAMAHEGFVWSADNDGGGEWVQRSGLVVHHVNGDSRDNCPENLRVLNPRENVGNAPMLLSAEFGIAFQHLEAALNPWEALGWHVQKTLMIECHVLPDVARISTVVDIDPLRVQVRVEWSDQDPAFARAARRQRERDHDMVDSIQQALAVHGPHPVPDHARRAWAATLERMPPDQRAHFRNVAIPRTQREATLTFDLVVWGEAFVDGDGNRVPPATVRTTMQVETDDMSRSVLPAAFRLMDRDGNVVQRWIPTGTGDPSTDPVARAHEETRRRMRWYNERLPSVPFPPVDLSDLMNPDQCDAAAGCVVVAGPAEPATPLESRLWTRSSVFGLNRLALRECRSGCSRSVCG